MNVIEKANPPWASKAQTLTRRSNMGIDLVCPKCRGTM